MGLLDQFWGKKNFQWLFDRLHSASLKGMNYGRASDYQHNGESEAIRAVCSMIPSQSAVLFDVGANQGNFTNHILEAWQGMTYDLYAFEPSKRTFELLQKSVRETTYVHLVNKGFGEKPGHVKLFSDKEGSGLASVYPRDLSHRKITFTEHETIELTTLDIFCEQNMIPLIDFLKLDVEGHELAVLRGGKKMIEGGRVSIIQFEFGGCNIDSRTFFRDYYDFFKRDFNLFRILSNGLQPIDSYSEKLEIFQSANYLAVQKENP